MYGRPRQRIRRAAEAVGRTGSVRAGTREPRQRTCASARIARFRAAATPTPRATISIRSNAPAFIARGNGCRVWDTDGREFIEYGMGLRAVTLGHAYRPVVDAAIRQMRLGTNFNRPSPIEVECAEALLGVRAARRHGQVRQGWLDGGVRCASSLRGRIPAASRSRSARTTRSSRTTTGSWSPPGFPAASRPTAADETLTLPLQRPRRRSSDSSPSIRARSPASCSSRRAPRNPRQVPAPAARTCASSRRAVRARRDDHRVPVGDRRRAGRLRRRAGPRRLRQGTRQRLLGLGPDRPARDHGTWRTAPRARARVPAVDDARRRDAQPGGGCQGHRDLPHARM